MILLLLSCFTLWSRTTPFKEELHISDTTVVIPIDIIRKANIKLIEGNYYKEISYQKDTIINDLNNMVSLYISVNDDLANKLITQEELNKKLQKNLDVKRKVNNILIGTTTVGVLGTIILYLLK